MPLPDSAAFLTTDLETAPESDLDDVPPVSKPAPAFAGELIAGLTRSGLKEISSSWLYDELGSVLFEAITLLPQYGLTRADERVIQRCAPQVAREVGPHPFVAELGSGSGKKTRTILAELLCHGPVEYAPIDVSAAALENCALQFSGLNGVELHPTVGSYLDGLALAFERRRPDQKSLVLFLGSTIGNFRRPALPGFLSDLRALLLPGDYFLVGADLEKDPCQLELAYDDPVGVTAAFNRNLLAHLNTTFDADFNLSGFRHVALYNRAERRIEMYLESVADQEVILDALDLRIRFQEGERIRTELSHKFHMTELRKLAEESGFRSKQEWLDREWPFAECLWVAA